MLTFLMIWGCGGATDPIEFPDGLEPLPVDNTAEWPANNTEAINTNGGEDGDLIWVHARAYIHNTLDAIYPCLQEPEINLDRQEDPQWSITRDVEEGYEHSYRLDITVENILTVEYEDTWRHGSVYDEDDVRNRTVTAWQMTQGNSFMTIKRGSLVADVVEAEITSLDIIYEMDVALPDEEQMIRYLEDVHAELIACSDGDPLPPTD
ncbi:MAG: hypothetical protein AAFV53_32675 [Myxococcota bacterium]